MAGRKWNILVIFIILLIVMEGAIAAENRGENGEAKGDDNDKGKGKGNDDDNGKGKGDDNDDDKGKGKEKDKDDKGKGKDKKPKGKDSYDAAAHYDTLTPLPSGQERAFCKAKSSCQFKTLVCPAECPQRKPKKNKKNKGCFVNCSSKCEATCKVRRSNCDGYGSLCYDPRFVGGDGVMFYFHGEKGGNFTIVSDDEYQINAHFIGTRPKGRPRDYTWVQALAVMFDTHTLVFEANKVSHWDDKVDSLTVKWDGEIVTIPNDEEGEWRANGDERDVVVERTDDTNNVRVTVSGLVEIDIRVRPIGALENKVHNYQLPSNDAFAHLELQFRFKKHTDHIEGVLGKTYRPGYVSTVKRGVPMPMMGGEDKYRTPSLLSTSCNVCKFKRPSSGSVTSEGLIAQY